MTRPRKTAGAPAASLKGSIVDVTCGRDFEVIVRLQNDGDRALHYINSVNMMLFDRASERLHIRLADDPPPFATPHRMEPGFSYVDPHSDAELKLALPLRVVRLAAQLPEDGQLMMEEDHLASAREVTVEIAWSDVPYYEDPRPSSDARPEPAPWAQGEAVMKFEVPRAEGARGKPSKRRRAPARS